MRSKTLSCPEALQEAPPAEESARETFRLDPQQRLLIRVVTALNSCGRVALRRIDIRVESQRIMLNGQVRSFYLKQLAQHVASSVTGVSSVDNCLVVEGDRP